MCLKKQCKATPTMVARLVDWIPICGSRGGEITPTPSPIPIPDALDGEEEEEDDLEK